MMMHFPHSRTICLSMLLIATTSCAASAESPTPTPIPRTQGPFVVKQIASLGGESISGEVCDLAVTFTVGVDAPSTTFVFKFVPQAADHGQVYYAYVIAGAGESHDAKGNYTIGEPSADGTLLLSMTVSDHVTFKGFSGTFNNEYKFNLVPSSTNTSCPNSP